MKVKTLTLILIHWALCIIALQAETRALPEVRFQDSKELYELLESRVSTRNTGSRQISEQALAEILWAGHGLTYESGRETVHGLDAVSSATQNPRYTVPTGSRNRFLRIYYLEKDGIYEYLSESHELTLISKKDLRSTAAGYGRRAPGKILVATDTGINSYDISWGYLAAGSVTQNMYLAAENHGISIFTEGWFEGEAVFRAAGISDRIKPLILLSFGQ